jgi:hypothetical protein
MPWGAPLGAPSPIVVPGEIRSGYQCGRPGAMSPLPQTGRTNKHRSDETSSKGLFGIGLFGGPG